MDNKTAICFVKAPRQCGTLHGSLCLASYYFIVQQAKIRFSDRLLAGDVRRKLIVDVALSNNFTPDSLRVDLKNSVIAVIDIIRATSTIATLFGSGVKSIIVAGTLDEAYSLKEAFPEKLLCGEKGGLKPDGFDYGNSPLEFSTIDLLGRQAILKTTNGTVSFLKAAGSPAAFSLAALNFRHTMDDILDYGLKNGKDILFLCSGEMGKVAYDDVYIAGLGVKYFLSKPRDFI